MAPSRFDSLFVFLLACGLTACGPDLADKKNEAPGDGSTPTSSNNRSSSNNANGSNGVMTTTHNGVGSTNGSTGETNNDMTCDGCVGSDGRCEEGTSPDACGVLGAACTVCDDGQACFEGECVEPPECGPDNCDGCCDSAGQCRDGDADAVCGSGGLACDECVDTESCVAGVCTPVCADTCAGCCDGETCLNGTDAAACGDGGDACVMCGDGRTCDAGECVVDPASRWELILVSGEISSSDPMGEPWDVIGTGDPVVTFEMTDPSNGVNYIETSTVAQDDITPNWNESLLTNVPARAFEQMIIDVWDSDFDLDDYVCGMNVDLSGDPTTYQDLFSGAVFSAECTNSDNSAVFARVDFRLQPN